MICRTAALLLCTLNLSFATGYAQAEREKPKPKTDWHLLDLQDDGVFGISAQKAYSFLAGRTAKTVIVAIIDAGVDTSHQDLKASLWRNKKERQGNNKDDDKNGYADDINGWNFLGSSNGNVEYDNLELTRLVREGNRRFANPENHLTDTTGLSAYKIMKARHAFQWESANKNLRYYKREQHTLDTMLSDIGKTTLTRSDVMNYNPGSEGLARLQDFMATSLKRYPTFELWRKMEFDAPYLHYNTLVTYKLNLDYDPRPMIGDNYENLADRHYGISDVTGPYPLHGTHVAGIIGAVRDNRIGIDGIANHVKLLAVRAVPNGDERDKDVANAIRYAVDNGAKVINMSFGKATSTNKDAVDEAVRYAMRNDVLIVHAAGNDGLDLDVKSCFPTKKYIHNGEAQAWLEVGASCSINDQTLYAGFSNYGKTTVDIFAPGEAIYSTTPGSKYEYMDGTSMAAPVVAGLAALLRSYFPKLTALQVKEIIMRSATKVDQQVLLKGGLVDFSALCISGGIVNAYEAVKIATLY